MILSLLVEKNKWNYVSRNLDQARKEEDEINVGVELRHIQREAEVESSEGEPTETHHYRIPSYHRSFEQIQKGRFDCTFLLQLRYFDVSLDSVYLHNLLESVPTLRLPGRRQQPLGRLRHKQEEGGEGKNSSGNNNL